MLSEIILKKQNIYIMKNNKLYMNKWMEIIVGLILVVAAILISFYSSTGKLAGGPPFLCSTRSTVGNAKLLNLNGK